MDQVIAAGVDALDRTACRAYLIGRYHPGGACCPACGLAVEGRQAATFAGGGRVHCNGCGRWYTWRSSAPARSSTADERQLFLLELLSALAVPVGAIARTCRLSDDTVRVWQRRLGAAS